jgi:hypothetical protein
VRDRFSTELITLAFFTNWSDTRIAVLIFSSIATCNHITTKRLKMQQIELEKSNIQIQPGARKRKTLAKSLQLW